MANSGVRTAGGTGTLSAPGQRKHVSALVPALERSIAILRHLQEHPDPADCTLAHITRALNINKSTGSNILRTLEVAGFVEYDVNSKSYRLGPDLIGLGASAAQRRGFVQSGIRHLEWLVRQTGFSCVAFEQLPSQEFVVVGKAESPKDIKVTIDVGQHFPPLAPAMARIAMAWKEQADVEAYIARWNVSSFTPMTKTDRGEIRAELARIREMKYAVSRGEYYTMNTAISAPVFSSQDSLCRGICLVAFSSEITDDDIPIIGQRVRAAAEAITKAIGGQFPSRPFN